MKKGSMEQNFLSLRGESKKMCRLLKKQLLLGLAFQSVEQEVGVASQSFSFGDGSADGPFLIEPQSS
ncbi:hypothetical protein M3202_14685 [Alkalihalobacillus oceani]|uniref:Uncharacterized protein n=1 Tax=Halalkalibacter oceani TaxID=1653776 RepID=A0A9X2DTP2_9BACI|nr:hypothetical protein [Halalkalibacter oceani]MCM3715315.1 hypothetical protein [Halalkalibacter oceani]